MSSPELIIPPFTVPLEQFARIEQIKRFAILDRELSQDEEELTPTFKVKRNVVYDRHSEVFDRLYGD